MNDSPFCPSCGTKRLGSFRFCRGCRLDFDTLSTDHPRMAPEPPEPTVRWAMPPTGVAAWIAAARAKRGRVEGDVPIIPREQLPDGW